MILYLVVIVIVRLTSRHSGDRGDKNKAEILENTTQWPKLGSWDISQSYGSFKMFVNNLKLIKHRKEDKVENPVLTEASTKKILQNKW